MSIQATGKTQIFIQSWLLLIMLSAVTFSLYSLNIYSLQLSFIDAVISHFIILCCLSFALAFVTSVGELDLSIGLVALLCLNMYISMYAYVSFLTCLLIITVASMTIGFIHGLLIVRLKEPSLLITFLSMCCFAGIIYTFYPQHATVSPLYQEINSHSLAEALNRPGLFITLLLATGLYFFYKQTTLGRHISLISLDEKKSHFMRIPISQYKILSYTLCSLAAGLTALACSTIPKTTDATFGLTLSIEAFIIICIANAGLSNRSIKPFKVYTAAAIFSILSVLISSHIQDFNKNYAIRAALLLFVLIVANLSDRKRHI